MPTATARILVADRDPVLRMLTVSLLREVGYEALDASNGDIALDMLEDPDNIDPIVISIQLDRADGIAIAQWARTRGTPVPVVFAIGNGDRLAQASAPGGTRRPNKPYTVAQLYQAIDSLLHEAAGGAP